MAKTRGSAVGAQDRNVLNKLRTESNRKKESAAGDLDGREKKDEIEELDYLVENWGVK